MILSTIRRLFASTVYIQLSEERIRIYHLENGAIYDQRPYIAIDESRPGKAAIHAVGDDAYALRLDKRYRVCNPFSHPRVLVSNFTRAEKVLQHGIRKVHDSQFFPASPVAIVHPLDKLEGGLTEIECRVFRELALGAGAREVQIHVGETLSLTQFEPDKIRPPTAV